MKTKPQNNDVGGLTPLMETSIHNNTSSGGSSSGGSQEATFYLMDVIGDAF